MDLNGVSTEDTLLGDKDDLALQEAWQKAYPDPREFMLFFVKKLKFYDERDKDMLLQVMRCQAETSRMDELEERERLVQNELREAQLEILQCHELLAKEREKYNKMARGLQLAQISSEDWRRKYNAVCYLTQTSDRDVAHFFQRNPNAASITDKMTKIHDEIDTLSGAVNKKHALANPMILGKKLAVLEGQILQIESDNRAHINEMEERYRLDRDKMNLRFETLEEVTVSVRQKNREYKDLVASTMHQFLGLKNTVKENERMWACERERIIRMMATAHNQRLCPTMSPTTLLQTTVDNTVLLKTLKTKLSLAEIQALEKSNLADKYKAQMIWLSKNGELRAEQIQVLKQKSIADRRKLGEKIKTLEKRIADDEKRRKFEGAGFREDVKNLKTKLSKLERMMKTIDLTPEDCALYLPSKEAKSKRSGSAPEQNRDIDTFLPQRKSERPQTVPNQVRFQIDEDIADMYEKIRKRIGQLSEDIRDSSL